MRKFTVVLWVSIAMLTAFVPVAHAAYVDTVQGTSGVSGYFRLGEKPTAGATAFSVVNGRTAGELSAGDPGPGTYQGSPARGVAGALSAEQSNTAPATQGEAASFDGVDDAVNLGDRYDFAGRAAFSIEFWVKPGAASTTYRRVLSKENLAGSVRQSWAVMLYPTGASAPANAIGMFRNDSAGGSDEVRSSAALSTTAWSHVVFTYDGSTMRVYVNGTQAGTLASSRLMPDTPAVARIGGLSYSNSANYRGQLDEVSVYTRALTASEVTQHRRAGLSRGDYADAVLGVPGLVNYLRLGETTGSATNLGSGPSGTYIGNPKRGAVDALADDTNTAVRLDASGDSIDLNSSTQPNAGTTRFTFAIWVKPSMVRQNRWERIFSREALSGSVRSGYFLSISDKDDIVFSRNDSSGNSDNAGFGAAIKRGRWTFVVVTYDGSSIRMYLDGVLKATVASTRSLPANPSAVLRLGQLSYGGGEFGGSLDEFASWSGALLGTEVSRLYRARAPFLLGVSDGSSAYGRKETNYTDCSTKSGTYYSPANLDDVLGRVGVGASSLNAGAIRAEFDGTNLTSRQSFNPAVPQEWDCFWDKAQARGLQIIPLVNKSGANGRDVPVTDSDGVQKVADAAAAIAARYGPGGTFWTAGRDATRASRYIEVWNEPYLVNDNTVPGGLLPGDTAVAAYAKLLRRVSIAVKKANPRVKVLAAADLYGKADGDNVDTSKRWITEMYEAVPDLGDHFDGIAVHPYNRGTDNPDTCNVLEIRCYRRIGPMRDELLGLPGGGQKTVVITEEGNPSCDPLGFLPPSGLPPWECVTENVQAERLQQALDWIRHPERPNDPVDREYSFVDGYLYYRYHEAPIPALVSPLDDDLAQRLKDAKYGLVRNSFDQVKPARQAFINNSSRGF